MNKINVLYQNLNFKSGAYSINDNLDTPIFASDETLEDLLKKASISNCESFKKEFKNASSTKMAPSFQKHPRYINDESLVSVNEFSIDAKHRIDNIIRKVTFKRHVQLDTSEASLAKRVPSCKIINTNVTDLPDTNLKELQDIEEIEMEEKNRPSSKKEIIKEEILGVKLKSYLIKICAWMQEIRTTIQSGIVSIEGFEDHCRRERRASEFASRFSRNYLYQLSRQLIELRRQTQKPPLSSRPGTPSAARSLTNACQTVLQAVQAYCNHIPTTISVMRSGKNSGGSVHAKFCELLRDTCDLCRVVKKLSCIYYDVGSCNSLVEDIETNSKSLISLVQNTFMKRDEPTSQSIKTAERKKCVQKDKHNIAFNKKNPLESRLSMYSVALKNNQKFNPNWKKNAEKLAKQKYNVQSRYKKPKQPTSPLKEPAPQENKCKSLADKRLSHVSDSTSQISADVVKINEDDIQTMVQMSSKRQDDGTGGIRSRLEPLLKTLVAEVAVGKEDDLLGQGVCEDMLLKLRDLLKQVQKPLSISMPDKMNSTSKNHITVTGPRNAKLICIKDKSLFESKTEVKTLKPKFDDHCSLPKSLSFLPALERNLSRKKLGNSESQTMANLPKQYTINIIQYKIEFHKYTKPLMMYRKSSQVLPWVLTSKITDSLFENLLFSIMGEINIDGLAEQIYRAEFETNC